MLRRGTHEDDLVDFAPPQGAARPRGAGLESRFEIHDDNQVELKLEYAIDKSSRWTRYQTEAFIFVPRNLGISRNSYAGRQFLADTQAYIRFKTPRISLSAITDPTVSDSPLIRLRRLVAGGIDHLSATEQEELSRELRMLGCVVRANLRDTVSAACDRVARLDVRAANRERRISDICDSVVQIAEEVDGVAREFREVRASFVDIRCPHWLCEHFENTDEFLSISIESYLTELLVALQSHNLRSKRKLRELTDDIWDRLARTISAEQKHRRQSGYAADLGSSTGRESYVYRGSALKKFITSVLFLQISPRREGLSAIQATASIAAALAMAFSLGAAFLSERIWGINSLSFVVALVIAYVFKDRIKDWVKAFFSEKISRWLPDRSLSVVDRDTQMTVGHCRETVSYLSDARIPESVHRWRHAGGSSEGFEAEYNPEVCLHYVKDVAILGKRITQTSGRRSGINDIIRWNVSRFLSRMDDPERHVEYFDAKSGQLQTVVCPKRYHLNIVLALKESGRLVSVQRFRVRLDRGGIHNLESVALHDSDEPASQHALPRRALATA